MGRKKVIKCDTCRKSKIHWSHLHINKLCNCWTLQWVRSTSKRSWPGMWTAKAKKQWKDLLLTICKPQIKRKSISFSNHLQRMQLMLMAYKGMKCTYLHKTLRTHLLEMIGLLHLKTKNNPKKQIQLIESMKQHLVAEDLEKKIGILQWFLILLEHFLAAIWESLQFNDCRNISSVLRANKG